VRTAIGSDMLTPSIWSRPPAALQLGTREVHVWCAYLPRYATRLAALASLLSADERMVMARFHFAPDRERYVLTRGLLRELLQRYIAVAPGCLQFSYGRHGKPALAAPAEGSWVRFNVSHAQDLAIYAFCRNQEVGIDIEYIRSDIEYEEIACHVFSPNEVATLFALPSHERAAALFRCWTMNEAYVKGHGDGLSIPLDQFDTAFTPGTPAAILATRPDPSQAGRWTLLQLDPAPDYCAALAVAGPIEKIDCWQVEP